MGLEAMFRIVPFVFLALFIVLGLPTRRRAVVVGAHAIDPSPQEEP